MLDVSQDRYPLFPQDAFQTTNVSSINGDMNLWNQNAPVAATSLPAIQYAPLPYPTPGHNAGFVNVQRGYIGQERYFAHGSIQSPGNDYNDPRYGALTSATALASGYDHQCQGMDDQFESEVMDWSESRFNGGTGA
ncbi:hypothetical protein BT96DRAFT_928958 [Gymnopus androsaceus JB14]|uniref:Uncharacterized protein n=1 Tax=Gymnopus androsaceus JB14 TaxID=1447944 RepID=A0A6A4GI24_9AGAR|nr:hypothetical protein BT96DRAFT_928958 [Gymnopus androsaceus JB14]